MDFILFTPFDRSRFLGAYRIARILRDEGYSKDEIDNAISDYFAIHIRSNILLHYWIALIVLVVVMIALVCYVQNLIWINTGP